MGLIRLLQSMLPQELIETQNSNFNFLNSDKVSASRKLNGYDLSQDRTLNAKDVGIEVTAVNGIIRIRFAGARVQLLVGQRVNATPNTDGLVGVDFGSDNEFKDTYYRAFAQQSWNTAPNITSTTLGKAVSGFNVLCNQNGTKYTSEAVSFDWFAIGQY